MDTSLLLAIGKPLYVEICTSVKVKIGSAFMVCAINRDSDGVSKMNRCVRVP